MHQSMIGTTGMDQDNHTAHDESSFGAESWSVEMNSFSQSGTISDYDTFGYMPHGLSSEPNNRMPPPPTPQSLHSTRPLQQQEPQSQGHQQQQQQQHSPHQQQQSQQQTPQTQSLSQPQHHPHSHTQLPMLIMPSNPTWPSMLTNPTSYSAPPVTLPPPIPPPNQMKPQRLPSTQQSTPRRTLTDEDRRSMCLYHEENPGKKQAEIGQMFGVERSTVSKVLRQKEKYLNPEDRSVSPVKRAKGKFPDIERALSAWARKTQQSGLELSDAEIWEKARHFAHGVSGGGSDNAASKLTASWLEKFKHKNGIGSSRLTRRASETNIPSSARLRTSRTPSGISPASPTNQPSPLSTTRSDDEARDVGINGYYDFPGGGSYKHVNSQSTTSLSSTFTDTAGSSFSSSAMSPNGAFTFSPESNMGVFLPSDQRSMPNFQRPRSQTFPNLDLGCVNQPTDDVGGQTISSAVEPLTPKFTPSGTTPHSILDSPPRDHSMAGFLIDSTITAPRPLHHSSSSGNLMRSVRAGSHGSPMSFASRSQPSSPTIDEARKALDVALNFVHTSVPRYDENDFMVVIRFFESVGLHYGPSAAKAQASAAAAGTAGLPMSSNNNALSRIPEGGEVEMANVPDISTIVKTEPMVG